MSGQDDRNRGVQRSQWLLFSVLAGAVLLLAVLWMGAGGGNNAPQLRGIDAELAGPGEAEAGWVRQSETRFGGIEARLRDIESSNRRLEDENLRLQLQLRGQAEEAQSVIDIQAARIEELTASGGTPLSAPATAPFGASDAIRPSVAAIQTGQPEPGAAVPMSAPLVREFRAGGSIRTRDECRDAGADPRAKTHRGLCAGGQLRRGRGHRGRGCFCRRAVSG